MKKTILAALLAAFAFSSLAVAGTIKIPSDDPICTVRVPDSWKPEETDKPKNGNGAVSGFASR